VAELLLQPTATRLISRAAAAMVFFTVLPHLVHGLGVDAPYRNREQAST
jgi:hypothetical protein